MKAIKLKCRGKPRPSVFLFQDNMPIYTAQVAVTEAANCSFELPPYCPYSPDLAPSDFFLFPKLKFQLHNHHFGNIDKIICTV